MITDRREALTGDGFPRSFSGTAVVDGERVHVVEGYIQRRLGLRWLLLPLILLVCGWAYWNWVSLPDPPWLAVPAGEPGQILCWGIPAGADQAYVGPMWVDPGEAAERCARK